MKYKLLLLIAMALFVVSCEKTEKMSTDTVEAKASTSITYPVKIASTKEGFITTTEGQTAQKLSNPTSSIKQYLAYVPKGYNKYQTVKWPLVVYLHNGNAKGTDIGKVRLSALPTLADIAENDYQFVLISPQLEYAPSSWDSNDLNTMVSEISAKYSIDPNLIVITGEGIGGAGVWSWALQNPEKFTAIIPIGGWANISQIKKAQSIPAWAFAGSSDGNGEKDAVNALRQAGGNVQYTSYSEDVNNIGKKVYSNNNLLNWSTNTIIQRASGTSPAAPSSPTPPFVKQTEGQTAKNLDNPLRTIRQYLAYIPPGYNSQPDKKWPIVINLHGSSELGTDVNKIFWTYFAWKTQDKHYPFVLITPQLLKGSGKWNPEDLDNMVTEVISKYNVDPSRIYLNGYSLGGNGVWQLAEQNPQRYAAVVAISGWGNVSKAPTLKNIPIWAFHGQEDKTVNVSGSVNMINAIKNSGGTKTHLTLYPGQGHLINDLVFGQNDDVVNWMLAQRK